MLIKAVVLALIASHASPPQISREPAKGVRLALTCFKSGEQVSGMNKICYYNCLGSQTAINVGSVEICPLTIDR